MRGSAYMVTARPSDSDVENKGQGGFLPTAVAADPKYPAPSDNNSPDQQIDDLLNSDSPTATFQQVYLLLKDQFVDRIDSDQPLAHGAASALLSSLDEPNSRFLEADERKALEEQATGKFEGIGAVFTVRKVTSKDGLVSRNITVIDPLPGSPAFRSGLKTGDVVTNIDKHWIIGYDPFAANAAAFKKLANNQFDLGKAVDATEAKIVDGYALSKAQTILDTASTKPLTLTILRSGSPKPIDITVDGTVPTLVKDVEFRKLDDGNGYVAFNVFTTDTAKNFNDAVTSMGDTKGLVIDLRDCAGGLLDPAVDIAQELAPNASFGEIQVRDSHAPKSEVSTAGFATKSQELNETHDASLAPLHYAGPICVLVNHGTANTAELLAAFLHDHLGAKVIGGSTFGDASAQTLFPLSDDSAFTLTTGVLKTDRGLSFNTLGIAPDVVLADPGHAGDDSGTQLAKAEELLEPNLGAASPPP